MNPMKNSQNSFGISKIIAENDEFHPNHTIVSRGLVRKFDGGGLGFMLRVRVREDGAKTHHLVLWACSLVTRGWAGLAKLTQATGLVLAACMATRLEAAANGVSNRNPN